MASDGASEREGRRRRVAGWVAGSAVGATGRGTKGTPGGKKGDISEIPRVNGTLTGRGTRKTLTRVGWRRCQKRKGRSSGGGSGSWLGNRSRGRLMLMSLRFWRTKRRNKSRRRRMMRRRLPRLRSRRKTSSS